MFISPIPQFLCHHAITSFFNIASPYTDRLNLERENEWNTKGLDSKLNPQVRHCLIISCVYIRLDDLMNHLGIQQEEEREHIKNDGWTP